jgi:hypothetical protein
MINHYVREASWKDLRSRETGKPKDILNWLVQLIVGIFWN